MKSCPIALGTEHQIHYGKQIFLFSATVLVCNNYQKPKKTNFASIFSVLLLCKKRSIGLPGARKQTEKQCFLWKCHFREEVYLVGWAARGSLGAAGFLLDCSALRLEFLSQLSLACGTHHSMSWQLSTLARHGCLWRDAVLKG